MELTLPIRDIQFTASSPSERRTGLLGWVHLAPPELLEHYDAILALDIGGTNVR